MVFRNKYTGKINWIPLLGTIAGGLFLIVLLTVILSEGRDQDGRFETGRARQYKIG